VVGGGGVGGGYSSNSKKLYLLHFPHRINLLELCFVETLEIHVEVFVRDYESSRFPCK